MFYRLSNQDQITKLLKTMWSETSERKLCTCTELQFNRVFWAATFNWKHHFKMRSISSRVREKNMVWNFDENTGKLKEKEEKITFFAIVHLRQVFRFLKVINCVDEEQTRCFHTYQAFDWSYSNITAEIYTAKRVSIIVVFSNVITQFCWSEYKGHETAN